MTLQKPRVRWVALYAPLSPGTRWFYNIALDEGIGCGQLVDTPTDAPPEVAIADFRRVLHEDYDVPEGFEFENGPRSWGATFIRS